jgi:2-iminobutanoate/2-iminopropanoate deaminase
MKRKVIEPPNFPSANSTYSQAIQANGFIFVSGQIGIDPKTGRLVTGGILEETRQAIENTAEILQAAGSSLRNVVSASLFLTQFARLSEVNKVYGRHFPEGGAAKMSCGVTDLYGGASIEIQVIALE